MEGQMQMPMGMPPQSMEGQMQMPMGMPPQSMGQYRPPRLTWRQRWEQHGPLALNTWIWIVSGLCGVAAIIIYSLFLSHCVSAEVAGMYLFKLSLGNEVVQVAYLGMCAKGKRPGITFNADTSSILDRFGTTSTTDLGRLLIAGRGIQSSMPIVFIFPFLVLILFALWSLSMTYLLRHVMRPRGMPGQPLPMMQVRVHRRLEWITWYVMVFTLGIPAIIVAIGAAWSTMTSLQTVVSLWGNLATVLKDPDVAVVQKGSKIEVAHWVAAVLIVIFGTHTGRLFLEARRILARNQLLDTKKVTSMDQERLRPEMMDYEGAQGMPGMPPMAHGAMPAMFPGTNIPMQPGV